MNHSFIVERALVTQHFLQSGYMYHLINSIKHLSLSLKVVNLTHTNEQLSLLLHKHILLLQHKLYIQSNELTLLRQQELTFPHIENIENIESYKF
jgi:hypothetical protein